jgi:hypothetical protein
MDAKSIEQEMFQTGFSTIVARSLVEIEGNTSVSVISPLDKGMDFQSTNFLG